MESSLSKALAASFSEALSEAFDEIDEAKRHRPCCVFVDPKTMEQFVETAIVSDPQETKENITKHLANLIKEKRCT